MTNNSQKQAEKQQLTLLRARTDLVPATDMRAIFQEQLEQALRQRQQAEQFQECLDSERLLFAGSGTPLSEEQYRLLCTALEALIVQEERRAAALREGLRLCQSVEHSQE